MLHQGTEPVFAVLVPAAPFHIGSPVPRDGVVSARTADVITVSYQQPDGAVLSDTLAPIIGGACVKTPLWQQWQR